MDMRNYRGGDEKISLLGFGAMRLPRLREEGQEIDSAKAFAMVDYAIAHGVNYFDTAYVYHEGMSETFLGMALSKHPRDSYNIATKMPLWILEERDEVRRIFNEQLIRCGVEYFDYYLLHNLNAQSLEKAKELEIYEQLNEFKKGGLIRKLGFSFHDKPQVLEEVVALHDWDFAQIQLNYLDWEEQDAKAQYEILHSRGIPVVVMEPVRGGTLSALCDESIKILRDANPDATAASWAMRFAGSLPGVLTVLSGMTEPEQVRDNVATFSPLVPLSDDERAVLDRALAVYRAAGAVPCTACRYCMDCPSGVDIPKVFGIYNRFLSGYKGLTNNVGNNFIFGVEYKVLGEEKQPHNCTQCGICATHCPQALDIPTWMKTVADLSEKINAEVQEALTK